MQVNKLTGEVTETIGGIEFKLHATIGRMAEFERLSGEKNVAAIVERLAEGSARTALLGFEALCSSENAAAFKAQAVAPSLGVATVALIAAIAEGMPVAEAGDEKKGSAGPA